MGKATALLGFAAWRAPLASPRDRPGRHPLRNWAILFSAFVAHIPDSTVVDVAECFLWVL